MNRQFHVSIVCACLLWVSVASARGQFGVVIQIEFPLNNNAAADTGADVSPHIATDGAGHWVAAWDSDEANIGAGVGTDHDILVSRSTDNGATWTDPAPLNNNAGTDSDDDNAPIVATDGAGHWVAAWVSREPDIGGGIGADYDIVVARSTDNGVTWTDPAPLNNNAAGDAGTDYGLVLTTDGAGVWIAVWSSDEPDIGGGIGMDSDIVVARSTDNGATWTDPAPLNNNAGADTGGDTDPQIDTDGAGHWAVVWMSDETDIAGGIGADLDVLVARSADNGATWTDPAPLNNNAGADTGGDAIPRIASDRAGLWTAVWDSSEPDIAGGLGLDSDIFIVRSTDNGATWTDPAPLNNNAETDTGSDSRAQIAVDAEGNWVSVWHSSEPDIVPGIGPDLDCFIARSWDGAVTWTTPVRVNLNADTDPTNDFNPFLVTDRWGNWIVVWWTDGPDIAGGIGADHDIITTRFALPDCNLNEIGDGQDIADGTSEDCDGNGVPDECESDIDDDGAIDACDNCILTANADQNDADADGVGDACDLCPDDPDKTAPGVCGCGNPDTDTDGDGAPDCVDPYPHNPDMCGCGNGILAMLPITLLGCSGMRRRIRYTPAAASERYRR